MLSKKPKLFRTLLAGVIAASALTATGQQETFVIPPQKIDFHNNTNTTLSGFVSTTYTAANSGYDGEGNVKFTVMDDKLLDANGVQVATFPGITNAYTISIVPKPGSCDIYSVFQEGPYFSTGTTVDRVRYSEVDASGATPVISLAPITVSSGPNFNRGIAISKLDGTNQRNVYIGSLTGIDSYKLSSTGLSTATAIVYSPMWYGVHELELSESGQFLFWSASQGGPFIQRLDLYNIPTAIWSYYPVRAHSIEYSPIDDKLYFIRSGRLFKVNSDLSGSHTLVASNFSQSTIEKNHEGLIIGVTNKTTLNTYDPATGTTNFGVYTFPAVPTGPGTSNIILPDQVDGEDYVTHPTVGAPGTFYWVCQNDPPFDIPATPAGGTYSGTALGSTFIPSFAMPGNNLVTYTTLNDAGCPAVASVYVVVYTFCKGGEDGIVEEQEVSIFPNPAADFLNISGVEGSMVVTLTDLNGRQVIQERFVNQTRLAVDQLPAGTYILHLRDDLGNEMQEKIVLE